MSSPISALLASNASYASNTHHAPPAFPQLLEMVKNSPPEASRICIITCADPRLDPAQFLNLSANPNITPVIMRNAGGSARKALPDILAVDSLVSFTHIFIVRHTDCGSTHFRNEDIKRLIHGRLADGHDQGDVDSMEFGECTVSPEDRCLEDVEWLRGHEYLRKELRGKVSGGVFSLGTGKVELVG